ncbi:Lrp/AsnC family transcriptional regulator [Hoeflea sp.]|uniref:Lrp/AsnC family transcriptional regulator n=1 Tax=Hoeflea sp. TaxID=1940281 RepID=UPI0019BF3B5F|nr:Lrp/AsnC family transcriptional regulator [Hoeflea sp.]MBC7285180.1 Lrp/AsnC family transcriptional regulator [Hoeflea sp.]
MTFDRIDLKILDILQRDATVPVARIAEQVGLSQTPCWKRIRKHEEAGVIRARVALLNPDAFGLSLTAFVMVEAVEHTADWRASFLAAVEALEPVRDVYRLAGAYDFLLRVVVPDMASFDRFYESLTATVRLRSVNSVFALEAVRTTTSLPLSEPQAG